MLLQLIKQAASVAGLRVLGTGMSVLVSIAIARLYGAYTLGIYAYCVALMAIAAVPISNGWSTMLLRTVSRGGELSGLPRAMAKMGATGAILATILAAFLAFAAIHLAQSPVSEAMRPIAFAVVGLLSIALLSDQLSAMRMFTIRGLNRPALAQLPENLVRPLVLLVGLTGFWYFIGGAGPSTKLTQLFVAMACAALFSALVGQIIIVKISEPDAPYSPKRTERKSWIVSAGALAGSAGLVQLNGYVDMLLLGNFVSPEEIGHYRAALQFSMLANFGYIALNMLAGQRFARLLANGDQDGLAWTATIFARLALLSALPLPLIIWFFGPQLLSLLFGSAFAPAATPALVISIGFSFSASIGMAYSLLTMSHEEVLALRLTGVALLINIGLCILLIPQFGLTGAAAANMVASVSWNMLLWYFTRKRTGFDTSVLGLAPKS